MNYENDSASTIGFQYPVVVPEDDKILIADDLSDNKHKVIELFTAKRVPKNISTGIRIVKQLEKTEPIFV